jgi:peroxiredoxin
VAVTPQIHKFTRQIIDKHQLTFEILSDPGNELAGKFGLIYDVPEALREVYLAFGIDLQKFNADGTWHLPMPARYVIDGSSVIRWSNVSPDYTVRPDPAETIAFIREMVG